MISPEEIIIQKSVLIKTSTKSLYQLLRNFENVPYLLDFLENAIVIDKSHYRLSAKISDEQERIIWDIDIVREIENEFFEWHSSGSTEILHEGTVRFSQSTLHKGTVVSLQLRFFFPAINDSRSSMLGEDFENRIQDNLLRFKQAVEANEFPRPRDNKNDIPEGFSSDKGPWRNFL
jgi:uncharacterized membrane protein